MTDKEHSRLSLDDVFEDSWLSHPFFESLARYKKPLLWALLALVIALIVLSRFIAHKHVEAEKDYLEADKLFIEVESNPSSDKWSSLQAIMARYPELKAKYDGPLAQAFLVGEVPAEAKPLIAGIEQRTTSDALQFYNAYTNTSLLVAEGKYAEALPQAQALEQKLNKKEQPVLYVFNSVRLALLYGETHQLDQERAQWERLEQERRESVEIGAAMDLFRSEGFSLAKYIQKRGQNSNF